MLYQYHFRYQSKQTKTACAVLYSMWREYRQGAMSVEELTAKAGNLDFFVALSLRETA